MKTIFNWSQDSVSVDFFQAEEAIFGIDGQQKSAMNTIVGKKRPQPRGRKPQTLSTLGENLDRTGRALIMAQELLPAEVEMEMKLLLSGCGHRIRRMAAFAVPWDKVIRIC